jgi:hypothetical protein
MVEPAYRIDLEEREIVIRLRRDSFDHEEVSRFLDYLEMESIRSRSELTETDAAALAAEIDRKVWDRNRARVSQ